MVIKVRWVYPHKSPKEKIVKRTSASRAWDWGGINDIKRTERIRKKHEQLSKEYYENTLEPYLSQQADRFNISSEEMIADIKNINNYI